MVRILFFLLFVLLLGLGFAWLADRPGDMVVTFGAMRYELTLMVAAVAAATAIAAVMIAWWLLKGVWNSPHAVRRYFRARKRDRGYQSLSTGMIAAGAGDQLTARKMAKQAASLLSSDQEPLIRLLEVQTTLLEGDHDAARAKFETMLSDPETEVLGLRGLYLEAERAGNREAARHYAERAVARNANLGWAGTAALQLKTLGRDWDGALAMLDKQRSVRQVEKPEARRKRAVLLTAKAIDAIEADPTAARNLAMEANKLAPDLVPAAVTAAEALFRLGDLRRGASLLEKAWKQEAHPDIARAYVSARSGDSAIDRLKRARKLRAMRTSHPESLLAVAQAALGAGEFREAREALEAVIRTQPRESAWLLLADVEEAETGDQGRVRAWLAKAVRAPRDPAWTADGYVCDRWLPASPVTGEIDAFRWKVPVEELAPAIDSRTVSAAESPFGDEPVMPPPGIAKSQRVAAAVPPAAAAAPAPAPVMMQPAPAGDVIDAEIVEAEPAATPSQATEAEAPGAQENGAEPPADAEVGPDRPPSADDPGIDPQSAPEKPRRFRLF